MKNLLKNFIFPSLSICILCVAFSNFITGFISFPDEIRIMEGTVSEFEFALPIKATIEPESTAVLKINDEPLLENITMDIDENVTLESDTPGQAEMTLSAFGMPNKTVTVDVLPEMEIIPCGTTVGVKIHTDGVMVLGIDIVQGSDGNVYNPSEGVLESGDLILKANNQVLNDKDDLMKVISESEDKIDLEIKRDDEILNASITPAISGDENEKKIGAWVRDGTQGIGTVTYYNPETNKFGALGHGILDVDTKQLMTIQDGEIMEAEVVDIVKGEKGVPGELIGEISEEKVIGSLEDNSNAGIYGTVELTKKESFPTEKYPIASQEKIHEGPATIKSTIDQKNVEEFDIYIESVNHVNADDTKGMVIRITDPELLKKTNGIVQGMSGSPILQDGYIVGALTHVFVQDPAKGYGVFIENMLKHEFSM